MLWIKSLNFHEKDNSILHQIIKTDDYEATKQYIQNFEEVWNDEKVLKNVTDEVLGYIADLYKENSPEFIEYIARLIVKLRHLKLADVVDDRLRQGTRGELRVS